jgi:DNA-binding transcriptional ArsR family regulator
MFKDVLPVRLFKALCDPSRSAILSSLLEKRGASTVSQIAVELPIDLSVVSRHLASLREAGVVAAEKVGREMFYSVRNRSIAIQLRKIADVLEAHCPPEPDKPKKRKLRTGKKKRSVKKQKNA